MPPKKKIRLIALDVDGTLLDDRKKLPPENRAALQEVVNRGVKVVIASGRMLTSIEPIERALEIDCGIIAYNGGKVVSARADGRRCLDHRPVAAEVAAELIRFSREEDHLLNFYHEDVLYAEDSPRRRELMAIYAGRTTAAYHITDLDRLEGAAPTKLILLAEPAERDRLYLRFQRELAGRASVAKSEPEYMEVMAIGVDKGAALPVLARHYGVDLSEVLAMGDADNDRQLLAEAGLGVAVANAAADIRAGARRVTTRTNGQGAVAEAVERWVLGDEEW